MLPASLTRTLPQSFLSRRGAGRGPGGEWGAAVSLCTQLSGKEASSVIRSPPWFSPTLSPGSTLTQALLPSSVGLMPHSSHGSRV